MGDEFGFGNPEVIEEEVDILLIGGDMACCGAVSPRRMPSTKKSCPICIGPCTFVPTHGPAHYPATVSILERRQPLTEPIPQRHRFVSIVSAEMT